MSEKTTDNQGTDTGKQLTASNQELGEGHADSKSAGLSQEPAAGGYKEDIQVLKEAIRRVIHHTTYELSYQTKDLEKRCAQAQRVNKTAKERVKELTIQRENAEQDAAKLIKEVNQLEADLRRTLTGYNSADAHKVQQRLDTTKKKLDWEQLKAQGYLEAIEEQEAKVAESQKEIGELLEELVLSRIRSIFDLYNILAEPLAQLQSRSFALSAEYEALTGDFKLLQNSMSLQGKIVGSWHCIPQLRLPQDRKDPNFKAKKGGHWDHNWPEDVRPFYQDYSRGVPAELRSISKYDDQTYILKD